MVDLVEWLTACLDEDERIAREAGSLAWSRPEHPGDPAAIRDSEQERVVCDEGWPSEGQTVHIAEWDPARVLREIDAKRRLLNDHPIVSRDIEPTVINGQEVGGPYYAFGCANCHGEADSPEVNGFGYCFTWKVIASVYVDRDGYREEWRP